jgi:hypothetical protein
LQKQDGEMASMADDDRSEIEQYHWQTNTTTTTCHTQNFLFWVVHKKY